MAACMCYAFVLGRAVRDPDFRSRFIADPAGVYRHFGGSRLVSAFKALTEADRKQLDRQLRDIGRSVAAAAKKVTDPTGLDLVLGQGLADPAFHAKLLKSPLAAVTEYLGRSRGVRELASFFRSKQFKVLGTLESQRASMTTAGQRFGAAMNKAR